MKYFFYYSKNFNNIFKKKYTFKENYTKNHLIFHENQSIIKKRNILIIKKMNLKKFNQIKAFIFAFSISHCKFQNCWSLHIQKQKIHIFI